MVTRTDVVAIALALTATFAAPLRAAELESPKVRSDGAIAYLSGGISEEGVREVLEIGKDFNLRVVFALTSGEYVADVDVKLADAKGLRLLDTVAEGPIFLAKLPAGAYRITASFGGQTIERTVSVTTRGQQVVYFHWRPGQQSPIPDTAQGPRGS
jgi:hypothetical protein